MQQAKRILDEGPRPKAGLLRAAWVAMAVALAALLVGLGITRVRPVAQKLPKATSSTRQRPMLSGPPHWSTLMPYVRARTT